MLEAIITGIGFGLVLAVLTGPVFFVGALLFGSRLFDFKVDTTLLGIVGSSILFTIGIYYIFKKADITYKNNPVKTNRAGYFFKGFLMCIFNPSLLFHWITVIGAASTIFHRGVPGSMFKTAVMFTTILSVQFGLDTTKAFYANKLRDKISVKTVHRLNQVAGIALILGALVIIDRLITHFVFPAQ